MNNHRINIRTGSDNALVLISEWLQTFNLEIHSDRAFSVWQSFQPPVTLLFQSLPPSENGTPRLKVTTRDNAIIVFCTDITCEEELFPSFHTENAIREELPNFIHDQLTTREVRVTEQDVEAICEAVRKKWEQIQIDVVLEYDTGGIVMKGGDLTKRIEVEVEVEPEEEEEENFTNKNLKFYE